MRAIGRAIAAARAAQPLGLPPISRAALARAVGVSAKQMRRYEAGECEPPIRTAIAIAIHSGVSLERLLELATYYDSKPDA